MNSMTFFCKELGKKSGYSEIIIIIKKDANKYMFCFAFNEKLHRLHFFIMAYSWIVLSLFAETDLYDIWSVRICWSKTAT